MDRLKHLLKEVQNQYIVACLFFTICVLALGGAGKVAIICALGIMLCAVGFLQGAVTVDLWVLLPLIIYNLFSLISSWLTYGNIAEGYASIQVIFSVIYLFMAYLNENGIVLLKRMCVIFAAFVALSGIGKFVYDAIWLHSPARLGGWIGNPNGMGIFLVLAWFAYMNCIPNEEEYGVRYLRWWKCIEPVIFIALALTLSMSSFAAMAVGIVAVLVAEMKKSGIKEAAVRGGRLLARLIIGLGLGILLYLAVSRVGQIWLYICLLPYIAAVIIKWEKLEQFLAEYSAVAMILSVLSLLFAVMLIIIRPSFTATFAERLDMMKNGVSYFKVNPIFGIGPSNWRQLNLYDSDMYFNVNHIHNAFIHVGAEQGLIAMAMLIVLAFRCLIKNKRLYARADWAAFIFHNMVDAAFFNIKITSLAIMSGGEPAQGGKRLNTFTTKIMFGVFAAILAYNFYWYVQMT